MANDPIMIDNEKVFELIEGLIKKMEKPEPLLVFIGKYIQAQTKKMFVTGRPDHHPVRGISWLPLDRTTILKKFRRKGGFSTSKSSKVIGASLFSRPLVDTGLLRDDLMAPRAIKVKNKGLEYGTNRRNNKGFAYPAIHQTGGGRNKMHPPMRKWLFLNEFELFQIGKSVVAWLENKKLRPGDFEGDV